MITNSSTTCSEILQNCFICCRNTAEKSASLILSTGQALRVREEGGFPAPAVRRARARLADALLAHGDARGAASTALPPDTLLQLQPTTSLFLFA